MNKSDDHEGSFVQTVDRSLGNAVDRLNLAKTVLYIIVSDQWTKKDGIIM